MMLVPNSITEELRSKDIFGLQALNEVREHTAITKPERNSDADRKENGDDRG